MRAAIYNPYLDTLGGGERYTMAVASTLVENGFNVDVQWKDGNIKNILEALDEAAHTLAFSHLPHSRDTP